MKGLRLGFVEGATPDKWARTWRELRPDHPLELVPLTQHEQEEAVRKGRVDMALVRLPVDIDALHVVRLYDEQPVALAGRDSYLAAAEEVQHVDFADDEVDWSSLSAADASATVANGDGVVVMPMSLARLHHRKDVVVRPVTDLEPTTVALVWLVERDDDVTQAFVGVVKGRTARSSR